MPVLVTDPLTIPPAGPISIRADFLRQALYRSPRLRERFAIHGDGVLQFVRIGYLQGAELHQLTRPYCLITMPSSLTLYRAAEIGFLTNIPLIVYLTVGTTLQGQDGVMDFWNFLGGLTQDLALDQEDSQGVRCRIESIDVLDVQRTDPDLDGTGGGSDGGSPIEHYWDSTLQVQFVN